jgi:hypothetical protein
LDSSSSQRDVISSEWLGGPYQVRRYHNYKMLSFESHRNVGVAEHRQCGTFARLTGFCF